TPGRYLRGAAFARCTTDGGSVVVVGSQLAADPAERPGQAHLLKKALADLDAPVILAADLNEPPDGEAARTLADGLVSAGEGARRAPPVLPGTAAPPPRRRPRRGAGGASEHRPVVVDLALPG